MKPRSTTILPPLSPRSGATNKSSRSTISSSHHTKRGSSTSSKQQHTRRKRRSSLQHQSISRNDSFGSDAPSECRSATPTVSTATVSSCWSVGSSSDFPLSPGLSCSLLVPPASPRLGVKADERESSSRPEQQAPVRVAAATPADLEQVKSGSRRRERRVLSSPGKQQQSSERQEPHLGSSDSTKMNQSPSSAKNASLNNFLGSERANRTADPILLNDQRLGEDIGTVTSNASNSNHNRSSNNSASKSSSLWKSLRAKFTTTSSSRDSVSGHSRRSTYSRQSTASSSASKHKRKQQQRTSKKPSSSFRTSKKGRAAAVGRQKLNVAFDPIVAIKYTIPRSDYTEEEQVATWIQDDEMESTAWTAKTVSDVVPLSALSSEDAFHWLRGLETWTSMGRKQANGCRRKAWDIVLLQQQVKKKNAKSKNKSASSSSYKEETHDQQCRDYLLGIAQEALERAQHRAKWDYMQARLYMTESFVPTQRETERVEDTWKELLSLSVPENDYDSSDESSEEEESESEYEEVEVTDDSEEASTASSELSFLVEEKRDAKKNATTEQKSEEATPSKQPAQDHSPNHTPPTEVVEQSAQGYSETSSLTSSTDSQQQGKHPSWSSSATPKQATEPLSTGGFDSPPTTTVPLSSVFEKRPIRRTSSRRSISSLTHETGIGDGRIAAELFSFLQCTPLPTSTGKGKLTNKESIMMMRGRRNISARKTNNNKGRKSSRKSRSSSRGVPSAIDSIILENTNASQLSSTKARGKDATRQSSSNGMKNVLADVMGQQGFPIEYEDTRDSHHSRHTTRSSSRNSRKHRGSSAASSGRRRRSSRGRSPRRGSSTGEMNQIGESEEPHRSRSQSCHRHEMPNITLADIRADMNRHRTEKSPQQRSASPGASRARSSSRRRRTNSRQQSRKSSGRDEVSAAAADTLSRARNSRRIRITHEGRKLVSPLNDNNSAARSVSSEYHTPMGSSPQFWSSPFANDNGIPPAPPLLDESPIVASPVMMASPNVSAGSKTNARSSPRSKRSSPRQGRREGRRKTASEESKSHRPRQHRA